jgi:hypothetical protein
MYTRFPYLSRTGLYETLIFINLIGSGADIVFKGFYTLFINCVFVFAAF